MTATTVLHVWAMKTGTTYIQQVLSSNCDHLRDHGVLFPGGDWILQARAVEEVLGLRRRDPPWRDHPHAWASLVREIRGFDGDRAVVSVEGLSLATSRQVRTVLRELGTDVVVVLTVRDAARVVPALWQTNVYNGSTISWRRFAREFQVAALVPTVSRCAPLWAVRPLTRSEDAGFVVPNWMSELGRNRVRAVTVPRSPASAEELWGRFAAAAGLEETLCTLPARAVNSSLGFPSVELLRLVNVRLGRLPRVDYERTVKEDLALRVLAQRRDVEVGIPLDDATRVAAARWNRRCRQFLGTISTTGTVDDLPVAHEAGARSASRLLSPSDDEILAAAADATEGLHRTMRRKRRLLRRLDASAAAAVALPAVVPLPKQLDGAVDAVADLVRRAVELDRLLRTARARVAEVEPPAR